MNSQVFPKRQGCQWDQRISGSDDNVLTDGKSGLRKVIGVSLMKGSAAVIDPDAGDHSAKGMDQNDVEIRIVIQIDDRDVQRGICGAKLENLAFFAR